MVEMNGLRCSTSCDVDCDAVCHEDHVPGHKKQHWPYDCPAAEAYGWGGSDFIAAAVKRLRGERDNALAELAAATARVETAEAEVARLREANAVNAGEYDAALLAIHEARDHWQNRAAAEFERAEQAESERDQLRARLAEIPETRLEWGIRFRDEVEEMDSEAMARETAAAWRVEVPKANPALMCRTVYEPGPWREADATPHAALEQLAAEQGGEEGGGDGE